MTTEIYLNKDEDLKEALDEITKERMVKVFKENVFVGFFDKYNNILYLDDISQNHIKVDEYPDFETVYFKVLRNDLVESVWHETIKLLHLYFKDEDVIQHFSDKQISDIKRQQGKILKKKPNKNKIGLSSRYFKTWMMKYYRKDFYDNYERIILNYLLDEDYDFIISEAWNYYNEYREFLLVVRLQSILSISSFLESY